MVMLVRVGYLSLMIHSDVILRSVRRVNLCGRCGGNSLEELLHSHRSKLIPEKRKQLKIILHDFVSNPGTQRQTVCRINVTELVRRSSGAPAVHF